jgi:hypothetical protein
MAREDTSIAATSIPIERAKFNALILANPNHFGNLKDSALKAVKAMAGNTTYEELKCVGYNPDTNLLKGVVWLKLTSGYSGGICSNGSQEYVRFYISFDNGSTWQDQGIANFAAYDVPGAKPFEFAVTVAAQHYSTWCFRESLPKVRAILSWNFPPPPNTPGFVPVWGNVVEAHIQIHPRRLFYIDDLLKEAKIQLPKEFAQLIDPKLQIAAPVATAASTASLLALYKDKGVTEHRTLFAEVQKHISNPAHTAAYAAYESAGPFAQIGVDIGAIINAIDKTNGDTAYEELQCIGLDPNGLENLVGILKIKRPYGYSGTQCQPGSKEYVAFWVDWGSGWQWEGTAQLNVHDFTTIPADGLVYAVAQPINLAIHRKPCTQGVVTAKVRAILSYAVSPPPADPDYTPTWGNRLETLIHIYPGVSVHPGDYTPYLEGVCGVSSCSINQVTGFAPGDRPFGGSVSIFGFIPGAPDISAANRPLYRCSVRKAGTMAWQHLNDPFGVTIEKQLGGGIPTFTPGTQMVGANDYYTYLDAPPSPAGWQQVFPSHLLAQWNTSGKTGLWEIMIEAADSTMTSLFSAGMVTCVVDGTTRQNVIIDLDNAAPLTSLAITGVQHGGVGPFLPAVDCATFKVGDVIQGSYSVTDEHFGSLSLTVQPIAHAHGAGVVPPSRSYPIVPTVGESGTWTLNTAGMDPCGYTIQLSTSDRTIVNCVTTWQNNGAFVGFCLVK